MKSTRRTFLGAMGALLVAPLASLRACTPEPQPAATFLGTSVEDQVESDVIYNISPSETPFMSCWHPDSTLAELEQQHAWIHDALRPRAGAS